MNYLLVFLASMVLALLITPIVRGLAWKMGVVDKPGLEERKKHGRVVPYLGGIGLLIVFLLMVYWRVNVDKNVLILISGAFLVSGLGLIDDVFKLDPWQKLIGQILVGCLLVLGGVGIKSIVLPGNAVLDLNFWQETIVIQNWQITISLISAFFTIVWMVMLMNVLNFLDGIDGLASGVSLISFFILFVLSISEYVNQPLIAILSVIMMGALAGFLPFNLPIASIFLGDSGSMFLGYLLGVMAIFSGAKVATVLIVVGLAILDTIVVIITRIMEGKKIWQADRLHLHYKMIDSGWKPWQVLVSYYGVSICLGILALFLPNSAGKFVVLLVLLIYFLVIIKRIRVKK